MNARIMTSGYEGWMLCCIRIDCYDAIPERWARWMLIMWFNASVIGKVRALAAKLCIDFL